MQKSGLGMLVKYIALGAIAIAIIAGIFDLGLNGNSSNGMASSFGITYHSSVCKTVTRADGSIEDLGCSHNTFKNQGRNITRDLLGTYMSLSAVNVIGLANGTGDDGTASQSNVGGGSIADCGLQAAAGTYSTSQSSAGNWTISRTFTSGCNNEVVNSTALYNSTSAGPANYFAANNFGAGTTLQNGDQITIAWNIWLS